MHRRRRYRAAQSNLGLEAILVSVIDWHHRKQQAQPFFYGIIVKGRLTSSLASVD
jgi:hypothetical protein